jgi:hypothetical protein
VSKLAEQISPMSIVTHDPPRILSRLNVDRLVLVNRLPRWLLPAVLVLLVLTVLIGSVIR